MGIEGNPLFYQRVTDLVAETMIHENFSFTESRMTSTTSEGLTYEEQNALRYASGYFIRALRK